MQTSKGGFIFMNFGKTSTIKKEKDLNSKSKLIRNKFVILFLKVIFICLLALVIVGGCLGYGAYKGILASAPDINTIDPTPTGYSTTLYDDAGTNIGTLVSSGANRKYVTIDEIPIDMQHAFVAIEDSRFYEHNGIDLKGIIRAGFVGLTSGSLSEGASTITQQLLKNNVFTDWTSEETNLQKIRRKIQEQYLAIELEKKIQNKDWILENYMNSINLGQNTLGVQAASNRYFGKDVSELTLSEAAVIAGITKNPYGYNPISFPAKNAKRREKVLTNMLDQGYISQKQYDEAIADDVYSRIQKVNTAIKEEHSASSYFQDELVEQVIDDLMKLKGYSESQAYKMVYSNGLSIYTTQNSQIQKICETELSNQANYNTTQISFSWQIDIKEKNGTIVHYTEQKMLTYFKEKFSKTYSLNYENQAAADKAIAYYKSIIMENGGTIVENSEAVFYTLQPQASVSVINSTTGEVKGLVGGRGQKTGGFTLNRASNTTRQPGSTFKIISTYAPALDAAGMTLATVQDNAPYSYTNGKQLKNYNGKYTGFTTIRQAITDSINIVAAKTLKEITPKLGYDYLLNFGFTSLSNKDIVESLALGGISKGVSNLELNAAYATIANGGTYTKPRFYTKILDREGNVIIDNTPQTHTVLKATTAWLLTSAMKDVITQGTGKNADIPGMTVAAKTGTTNDSRDSLFAGFSPYYSCVIWGGYDDNAPMASTSYTKLLWKTIMTQIHAGLANKDFVQPTGIVTASICTKSGKLAQAGVCELDPRGSTVRTEFFAKGTEPTEYCDHHVAINICQASGLPANSYCPSSSVKSSIYIVGGTKESDDGPYLLPDTLSQQTCTVHGPTVTPAATPNNKPANPGGIPTTP